MLYKKYRLYDEGIEIMIPSDLRESGAYTVLQNNFMSQNGRVVVTITKGGSRLPQEQLVARLNEYYQGFVRDVIGFECIRINKRQFLKDVFGELRYSSSMMGYQFYNVFILGIYEGNELIVTMQCMQEEAADNERVFDNIADSIRILKRDRNTEAR
ncbi:MAG: hypothetical protein LUE96_04065 [Lachnospiraceae bacterium]|nr:hypothetical protein [Lachnospiraceae bacterium]